MSGARKAGADSGHGCTPKEHFHLIPSRHLDGLGPDEAQDASYACVSVAWVLAEVAVHRMDRARAEDRLADGVVASFSSCVLYHDRDFQICYHASALDHVHVQSRI